VPIERSEFDVLGTDESRTPSESAETDTERILAFLRASPDHAFTQCEIAERTEVARGSVGPTLVRLRERGRVDHRDKYWCTSDYEQGVAAAAGHVAASARSRETDDETPSMNAWAANAVDPREHRYEN
jgi:DNA-binding IclR family transcriptional regulator